jgi:hypothetical protein
LRARQSEQRLQQALDGASAVFEFQLRFGINHLRAEVSGKILFTQARNVLEKFSSNTP